MTRLWLNMSMASSKRPIFAHAIPKLRQVRPCSARSSLLFCGLLGRAPEPAVSRDSVPGDETRLTLITRGDVNWTSPSARPASLTSTFSSGIPSRAPFSKETSRREFRNSLSRRNTSRNTLQLYGQPRSHRFLLCSVNMVH